MTCVCEWRSLMNLITHDINTASDTFTILEHTFHLSGDEKTSYS